jgi:hypothetical protein
VLLLVVLLLVVLLLVVLLLVLVFVVLMLMLLLLLLCMLLLLVLLLAVRHVDELVVLHGEWIVAKVDVRCLNSSLKSWKSERLGEVSPHAGDSLENRTADGALILVDGALASSEGNWIFATVSASVRQGGEALGLGGHGAEDGVGHWDDLDLRGDQVLVVLDLVLLSLV